MFVMMDTEPCLLCCGLAVHLEHTLQGCSSLVSSSMCDWAIYKRSMHAFIQFRNKK